MSSPRILCFLRCSAVKYSLSERLNLDVHASRQIELHQRIHRLLRRLQNIEEPLVRPYFKLFPGLLVHVRRAQNRRNAARRRQRNGTCHAGACPLRRIHDFRCGLIEHPVIVRLQPDANAFSESHRYFTISLTVPAPTVRPPSRIAKRNPLSMATGVISSTSRLTLSPGITISVPSGNCATPVTSVVRK